MDGKLSKDAFKDLTVTNIMEMVVDEQFPIVIQQ